MKVLSGLKVSRFIAGVLLMGTLVVSGHHFALVASADTAGSYASHHDTLPHSGEDHDSPPTYIEAHSPTPIVPKFQLIKQPLVVSVVSNLALTAPPPYRDATPVHPAINHVPAPLPLDLKTTFLN